MKNKISENITATDQKSLSFSEDGHIQFVRFFDDEYNKFIIKIEFTSSASASSYSHKSFSPKIFNLQNWGSADEPLPKFVTITGSNGIGKSSLLKYIHAASSGGYDFVNEVFFLEPKTLLNQSSVYDNLTLPIFEEQNEKYLQMLKNENDSDKSSSASFFSVKKKEAKKPKFDRALQENISYIFKDLKDFNEFSSKKDFFIRKKMNSIKREEPYSFWRVLFDSCVEAIHFGVAEEKASWHWLNAKLKKYNFPHEIKYENGTWHIENIDTKNKVNFEDFSSGEEILLMALSWACKLPNEQDSMTKILLLDEPDKHLDPKYCEFLVDIINEEFVKKGIQVFMTTHNIGTIQLPKCENIFMIHENRHEQTTEIIKVPKLRALMKMTPNISHLTGYHHKIYTESITDARFYQGVYESLKEFSNEARKKLLVREDANFRWKIGDVEIGRLLSRRYQMSFYSVNTAKSLSDKKSDGGCKRVILNVQSDKNAYENLSNKNFRDINQSASTYWRKNRNILKSPKLYSSFGILDLDYGIDRKLGDLGCFFTTLQRHSLENFVLDPIIITSIVSKDIIEEIHHDIHQKFNEKASVMEMTLINRIFVNLKLMVDEMANEGQVKQKTLNKYFHVAALRMELHQFGKNDVLSSNIKDYETKEGYKLNDLMNILKDVNRSEKTRIPYINFKRNEIFEVEIPNVFLKLKGHLIANRVLSERKTNFGDFLIDRIFDKGLTVMPLDLVQSILDLNKKVRQEAKEGMREMVR